MKPTLLALLVLSLSFRLCGQSVVPASSYSYSVAPHGSYSDAGNTELTDGDTATGLAYWPNPTPGDNNVPLVGWLDTVPTITFNFTEGTLINSATLWLVDSDGSAGVNLPTSFTLTDPYSSFTETFEVTNPPGNGYVVSFELDGFAVTTSALDLTWVPTGNWTMVSEVQFSSVPEPSTYAALCGVLALSLVAVRRCRSRQRMPNR